MKILVWVIINWTSRMISRGAPQISQITLTINRMEKIKFCWEKYKFLKCTQMTDPAAPYFPKEVG